MIRIVLLALLTALALAATASAAPVTGETADGADGAGTASQDVERAWASFDAATGELRLELTLRAPATAADDGYAAVHGVLYTADPARPGVCPSDVTTAELGRLEASTHPTRGGVAFGPSARGSRTLGDDPRVLGYAVTASELVGRDAVCLRVALSRNRPLDAVTVALAPGVVPPDGDPSEPALQPPVIVLAGRRPLRVGGDDRATLLLRGFRRSVSLSARGIRRPGGPTLIRGARSVERNTPVALRLKLTRAGRRALARDPALRIRLTVEAVAAGAAPGARTFRMTMRRR